MFEKHDQVSFIKILKYVLYISYSQLIMEVGTQYLINAFQNHIKQYPDTLAEVNSEESAEIFVLNFLESSKIEFYYKEDRAEDEGADDQITYCRDMASRLLLSLAIDRCEKHCDPLRLRALRRIMMLYFLNRKCKVQDSKVIF